jgi:hypothetical protein
MRKITMHKNILVAAAAAACLIFAACGNVEDDRNTYSVTFVATYYGIVGTEEWGKWDKDFEDWHMEWDEQPPGIGMDDDGNPIGDIDVRKNVEFKRSEQTNTLGRLLNIPTPPDRPDYEFSGWFTSGGTPVTMQTVFSSDTSVFAQWKGGENIITVGGGPVAKEFTRIRNEVFAGGQPSFSYTVSVSANETILPQTLDYGGRSVSIILNGIIPAGGTPPIITISDMGILFSVGRNVTLELRNIWLQGGDRNRTALLVVNPNGRLIIGQNAQDSTLIYNNGSEDMYEGGGVTVKAGGNLIMNGGVISNNASYDTTGDIGYRGIGGGGVMVLGTFTMNDGKIHTNSAEGGGGVMVGRYGKFTMNGGEIYDNVSPDGGGVHIFRGLFEMNGGKIHKNMSLDGGGIMSGRGIADATTASIYDPRRPPNVPGTPGYDPLEPENDPAKKRGFFFHGGEISNNGVGNAGGAICNLWGGFVYMDGGTISGNTGYAVAGIQNMGLFIMAEGTITKNRGTYGGGVDVQEGTFIMEGGKITENESTYTGGGVNVREYFIMYGGEITGNRAGEYCGGVSITPSGSFAMSGGLIEGNSASRPVGGTIYFMRNNIADMSETGTAFYGKLGDKSYDSVDPWGHWETGEDGTEVYVVTSNLEEYPDNTKVTVIDGELFIDDVLVPRTE